MTVATHPEDIIDQPESIISVAHIANDRFSISVRGHGITVDQPHTDGGGDAGPTPTELFVASLAACVAFYARRFLRARGLPEGVEVTAQWWMQRRPARVSRVAISIEAPGLPADRQIAFQRAIEHCTVHNSITNDPHISFEIVATNEPNKSAS